jgi:hypothetical protein
MHIACSMDPLLPLIVFSFVLGFIPVTGGGLVALLFGAAVVASLALFLHYFFVCSGVDRSETGRHRAALLVEGSTRYW